MNKIQEGSSPIKCMNPAEEGHEERTPQNMHATVKPLCMHIAIQSTSAMTILALVLISNVAYILVLATKVTLL